MLGIISAICQEIILSFSTFEREKENQRKGSRRNRTFDFILSFFPLVIISSIALEAIKEEIIGREVHLAGIYFFPFQINSDGQTVTSLPFLLG